VVLSFRKYLYWSLGLHFGTLALLIASPYLPFKPYRIREDKIVWVSLPKGTTDQWGSPMKKSEGLPKTTIEEQKKALESPPAGEKKPAMTYTPPPQEQKKVVEKPKTPPPPKRPGHPKSRIDEALARIQKEVATKKAEPEAAQIPETQPGGFTFGSAAGQYVSPDDPEYVLYQAKIRHRIMQEWILPMKYAEIDLGLICKIIVHINDRGEVTRTEWSQKSGNPSFDMSAMRAIEKASPLDIPPDRLKWEVFNEGFIVEFKPQPTQMAQ
jgi:colicin import membrane protein